MLGCSGLALVTALSAAGATGHSAYYEAPKPPPAPGQVQRYSIQGGYVLVDVRRDHYQIVQSEPSPTADTPFSDSGAAPRAASASPAAAQAYAASLVAARGWGTGQFSCLIRLWNQESGWNMYAENASSGAYGIPQALPGNKMGPGWDNNYKVQISWGLGYIAAVYGDPCGAWASEVARGSY